MLQKAVPVLPALHIGDTIDFYERKLGFKASNFGNYAILKYQDAEIHINLVNPKKLVSGQECYIFVRNIQDVYAALSAKDLIHPKGQLTDKPWCIKEFTVWDNNGNLLRFGEKR
jgi:hypothetical protein